MARGMQRHGIYSVQTVLDWVEDLGVERPDHNRITKKFEGLDVLSNLLGYKVFKNKGINCCSCPVEGEYFALEKTPGPGRSKYNIWHFNLYGKDSFGREVMITKDHITPKSKGGSNELGNLQPMCEICNTRKGSLHMKEFEAKKQGKVYDWDVEHAKHVIRRIKERYDLDMSLEEYGNFLDNVICNSEIVHNLSCYKSYRKVRFKKTDVYAVYTSLYKSIYTVLDPATIEERKADVPLWGKGREAECQVTYKTIMEIAVEENNKFFSEKANRTAKETAIYFSSCKYPTVMFALWKNKTNRLNVLLWKITKSILKINDSNENEETAKEEVHSVHA